MAHLTPQLLVVLAGLFWAGVLAGGCDLQRDPPPQLSGTDSTVYVNSIGIEFRRIPAGTFRMGSSRGQDDEAPVHEVEITEPFYMGATEVTQYQWTSLMEANPSHFRGLYRPVDSVSWYQATAFVDSLNAREDTDLYRLPTEAEWEYAARAGSTSPYYFGEAQDALTKHAWYSVNSEERSHRVAEKHSNPYGLHDVYGNVWEWVRDAYSPRYYERSARVNPVNAADLSRRRVIRGGGWFAVVSGLRSANRGWARPSSKDPQLGFRVVRDIPEAEQ